MCVTASQGPDNHGRLGRHWTFRTVRSHGTNIGPSRRSGLSPDLLADSFERKHSMSTDLSSLLLGALATRCRHIILWLITATPSTRLITYSSARNTHLITTQLHATGDTFLLQPTGVSDEFRDWETSGASVWEGPILGSFDIFWTGTLVTMGTVPDEQILEFQTAGEVGSLALCLQDHGQRSEHQSHINLEMMVADHSRIKKKMLFDENVKKQKRAVAVMARAKVDPSKGIATNENQ